MKQLVKNMLVNGPNFYLFTGVVLAVVMNQKIGYIYIITVVISHIVNSILKKLIKQKRPEGAKDCHDYVTCNEKDESLGMPSGHAQAMGLTLSFWLLYIWNQKQAKYKKVLGILFIVVTCISVIYSRISFKCHTELQTLIGALLGLLLGTISFKAFCKN